MHSRLRVAAAAAAVLLVAACRDQGTAPTEPQIGADPSSVVLAPQASAQAEEALSNAVVHPTLEAFDRLKRKNANPFGSSTSNLLLYKGGLSGTGVAVAPKIYLVVWGSQWGANASNDPSGEIPILIDFFTGVGASPWLNSVTQYCQGIASGSTNCATATQFAGNQAGMYAGVIYDIGTAAPSRPAQSDFAAEAIKIAKQLGNGPTVNVNAQYVIATATGNSSSGFKTQYCAYHSYATNTTTGNVAYTNLPYMTDAGANCGANFVSNGIDLGAKAGITIVEGHELGETITDQFPSRGWLDSGGAENGDKCSWVSTGSGAGAFVTLTNGSKYPAQALWSNKTASCVISY